MANFDELQAEHNGLLPNLSGDTFGDNKFSRDNEVNPINSIRPNAGDELTNIIWNGGVYHG